LAEALPWFWMLCLFAVVYGLAHGGFFTAISPLVAEWFGIGSHGTLFGIVVFFGTAGGSVGPLLAGHLFDHSGSCQSTFRMITAMALVAWVLMFSLKPVDKRALNWRVIFLVFLSSPSV